MIEKIKKSISLKISFLGLIGFIITKTISVTIDDYRMDVIVLSSICICVLSLIFFIFAIILEGLGKASKYFTSIFVLVYMTLLVYFLNYIVHVTFLSSIDIVAMITDSAWKILICATAILIFVKISLVIFGKQKIIEDTDSSEEKMDKQN